jgi:uncharacterized protein (TIGR02246 family)
MKAAIVAALFALMASPSTAQTAAGEIEMANQRFVQALNKGDAAMIAGMYTERALVLPPTADMIEGRAAIENYWKGVIAAGLRNLSLRSVRVDEYGDAVREIGWFSVEAPEPRGRTGTVEGKYVVVWRKSGGDWQHDSDIWNFTEPSAEPDAATGTSAAPSAVGSGMPSPSR